MKTVKLKSVVKVVMGLSPTGETYNDIGQGVPLLNGPTEFGETYPNCTMFTTDSKRECQKDDLIFCVRGSTTGRMNWADKTYSLGRGVCLIRGEENLTTRFVKYSLDYNLEGLLQVTGGGTFPNLRKPDIENFEILLPNNFKVIASVLSSYDDLIENNLKRIKLLEEMAQITFKEWFIKFKVNGEKLRMKNSLPVGWERKKIREVCKAFGGGTPSKAVSKFWDKGTITWFSPTDLSKSNSIFQIDSSNKITEEGLKNSSAKLLQPNSFMFSSRATIGLFGIVDKPFSTNQGFINVTPIEEFHKEFLFYNFLSRVDEFKGHATGSTFPELTKSKFNALDIVFPDDKTLLKFHLSIKPIHELIGNLSKQNSFLKEARDILLPRLMTGMIEV